MQFSDGYVPFTYLNTSHYAPKMEYEPTLPSKTHITVY